MQAIILVLRDGVRTLAFIAGSEFDVQAWAESRRAAFKLLDVRAVQVETL